MNVAWPELLLGAATMYALDPSAGRARRAALRSGTGRVARWMVSGSGRRLRHLAVLRRPRGPVRPLSDTELMERVRDSVADVSRPAAIQVEIEARRVTLSGPILARDVVGLLRHVARVPGVVGVNNRLRVQRLPWRRRQRHRPPPGTEFSIHRHGS